MRIIYIVNARIPTEKAHGIQIMEMCSAFSKEGAHVELLVPRRLNQISEDPFIYYHIQETFNVKKLFCVDLVRFGKVGYLVETFSFLCSVIAYAVFQRNSVFYTRDESIAFALCMLGKRVVWEGHMGQKNFIIRKLIDRKIPMVMITKSLRDLYVSLGVEKENIIVAPDGVDVENFDIKLLKEEARKHLGLPLDKKIVTYSGSLSTYSWKGVDVVIDAASLVNKKDYLFVFVGGTENETDALRRAHSVLPVVFVGQKPHNEIPMYLRASDVLVLPNKKGDSISEYYTSPMKLFEYMASGAPIVASNLPSIREILDTSNACLVEPNSPKSLVQGIIETVANFDLANRRSEKAKKDVLDYSWGNRAQNILSFIKK